MTCLAINFFFLFNFFFSCCCFFSSHFHLIYISCEWLLDYSPNLKDILLLVPHILIQPLYFSFHQAPKKCPVKEIWLPFLLQCHHQSDIRNSAGSEFAAFGDTINFFLICLIEASLLQACILRGTNTWPPKAAHCWCCDGKWEMGPLAWWTKGHIMNIATTGKVNGSSWSKPSIKAKI